MNSFRFRLARFTLEHHWLVLAAAGALTLFLLAGIRNAELKTIFSDLLPKNHPFVQVFKDHPNFGNPLTVTIMVQRKNGTIYNSETLKKGLGYDARRGLHAGRRSRSAAFHFD